MAIKLPGFNWKVPEGHRTKQKKIWEEEGFEVEKNGEGAEIWIYWN